MIAVGAMRKLVVQIGPFVMNTGKEVYETYWDITMA